MSLTKPFAGFQTLKVITFVQAYH